jgi:hypothetical protein
MASIGTAAVRGTVAGIAQGITQEVTRGGPGATRNLLQEQTLWLRRKSDV